MSNLTIKQLIGNAPGAYTRQIAPRYLIIRQLEAEFERLLRKNKNERAEFNAYSFFEDNEGQVRVWVKVPSTTFKSIQYDVVLDLDFSDSNYFSNAKVKYYTNSPAWLFTYAYVANENDYIIDDFKPYVSDKALNDAPNTTNPSEDFGFEKITQFALLFLTESKGIRVKNDLKRLKDRSVKTFQPDTLDNFSTDDKLAEYQQAEERRVEERARLRTISENTNSLKAKLEKNIKKEVNKTNNSRRTKIRRSPKRGGRQARKAKQPRTSK